MLGLFVGIFCVTGQFIIPDALATVTGAALIVYGVVYMISLVSFSKAEKTYAAKTEHKKIEEAVIIKESKDTKTTEKPSKKSDK